MYSSIGIFFTLLLVVTTGVEASLDRRDVIKAVSDIELYIPQAMEKSFVPGLAIAVVFEDEVLIAKGFGIRKIGSSEPVNARTAFQIASLSKPVTATVLASLVGEGKLSWDGKICDLDPAFRLSDSWITANLTIKDLLSHRSGLPDHAGDLLEDLGFETSDILYRLRFITALNAFRASYAYTNFGFSEAAYAAAIKAGLSWPEVAKRQLFDALQMTSTTYSYKAFINSENRATLHQITDGRAEALFIRDADAQAPAGGVSSSIDDLAKWVSLILADGSYQGKQLIDSKALLETQVPANISKADLATGEINFYGMGWAIKWDTEGRKNVSHNGGFGIGARTYVSLYPQDKIGVIVISNAAWQGVPEAIIDTFYDAVYQKPEQKDLLDMWNKRWSTLGKKNTISDQASSPQPAMPSKSYLGSYGNSYYGEVDIAVDSKGQLTLKIGPKLQEYLLTHLNRDVFTFDTIGENAIGKAQVIFAIDSEGQASSMTVDSLNEHGNGTFDKKVRGR